MTVALESSLDLKLVTSIEEFKELESDWNSLYEKSLKSTIFSSWDWMYTWWEVFHNQDDRQLMILCLYQHDMLVGLAPFQSDKVLPFSLVQGRTLRFIGAGEAYKDSIMSEFQDFLVIPGMEDSFISLVSKYLIRNKKKWDFADFTYLLNDSLISRCFTNQSKQVTRYKFTDGVRHSIPRFSSFDEYKLSLGGRWRKQFNKKSRLLARDGEVTTVSTDQNESIDSALAQLAEMNCARWKGNTGECIFESPKFYAFHQKILRRLVPKKKAYIKTFEHNGTALASYYAFEDKGTLHYYQSGFYAKHANKYSPLFVLVCNEIEGSIQNDLNFDFMYDEDPLSYKHIQYATETTDMYRLMWSRQPYRMALLKQLRAIKTSVEQLFCKSK